MHLNNIFSQNCQVLIIGFSLIFHSGILSPWAPFSLQSMHWSPLSCWVFHLVCASAALSHCRKPSFASFVWNYRLLWPESLSAMAHPNQCSIFLSPKAGASVFVPYITERWRIRLVLLIACLAESVCLICWWNSGPRMAFVPWKRGWRKAVVIEKEYLTGRQDCERCSCQPCYSIARSESCSDAPRVHLPLDSL